jgi:hypothetical protein
MDTPMKHHAVPDPEDGGDPATLPPVDPIYQ